MKPYWGNPVAVEHYIALNIAACHELWALWKKDLDLPDIYEILAYDHCGEMIVKHKKEFWLVDAMGGLIWKVISPQTVEDLVEIMSTARDWLQEDQRLQLEFLSRDCLVLPSVEGGFDVVVRKDPEWWPKTPDPGPCEFPE